MPHSLGLAAALYEPKAMLLTPASPRPSCWPTHQHKPRPAMHACSHTNPAPLLQLPLISSRRAPTPIFIGLQPTIGSGVSRMPPWPQHCGQRGPSAAPLAQLLQSPAGILGCRLASCFRGTGRRNAPVAGLSVRSNLRAWHEPRAPEDSHPRASVGASPTGMHRQRIMKR